MHKRRMLTARIWRNVCISMDYIDFQNSVCYTEVNLHWDVTRLLRNMFTNFLLIIYCSILQRLLSTLQCRILKLGIPLSCSLGVF